MNEGRRAARTAVWWLIGVVTWPCAIGCGERWGEVALGSDSESDPLTLGNSLPSNGLPSNGLPSNGLPSNGLPSNGLPSNGLSSNGLSTLSLAAPQFSNWFHWFVGCGLRDGCDSNSPEAGSTGVGTSASRAMAATIMQYVAVCACPKTAVLEYTDRAHVRYTWSGSVGLAPSWCAPDATEWRPASLADQEWVTACLLALVNRNGSREGSIAVSVTADPAGEQGATLMQLPSGEAVLYPRDLRAGFGSYFFGNIFGSWAEGQKGMYAGLNVPERAARIAALNRIGRDCAIDGCGVMDVVGFGAETSVVGRYFPDALGRTPPSAKACTTVPEGDAKSCTDTRGRSWGRVISVWLPTFYKNATNTRACSADGNGELRCTPDANGALWTARLAREVDRFVLSPIASYSSDEVKLRIRYKSNGTAKVRFLQQGTNIASVSLPSTDNWWRWWESSFTVAGGSELAIASGGKGSELAEIDTAVLLPPGTMASGGGGALLTNGLPPALLP